MALMAVCLGEPKDEPALRNPKRFDRLRPASPAAYAARGFGFSVCATSAMIFAPALPAQSPSQMNPQPSSVVQLSLSGRAAQTGPVSVTQSTTNTGGGNSVNIGGSVGISAANTIAQRHMQTHRNENVHWLSGSNWLFRRELNLLTTQMRMHVGPKQALLRAYALIQKGLDTKRNSGPMSTIFGTWPFFAHCAFPLRSSSKNQNRGG